MRRHVEAVLSLTCARLASWRTGNAGSSASSTRSRSSAVSEDVSRGTGRRCFPPRPVRFDARGRRAACVLGSFGGGEGGSSVIAVAVEVLAGTLSVAVDVVDVPR